MSTVEIPRPEYPRMQFRRENCWLNLNGVWDFQPDSSETGRERGWFRTDAAFDRKITVPFCMESPLSGVQIEEPVTSVFYRRSIAIPEAWSGRRILLHFGGADYSTVVWIDGKEAGFHIGGAGSWELDITDFAQAGKLHVLTVQCQDDLRTGKQCAGKQSDRFNSYGCLYTRVTGIWQTVWLEAAPRDGLRTVRLTASARNGVIAAEPEFFHIRPGSRFLLRVLTGGRCLAETSGAAADGVPLTVNVPQARLWRPEDPFLYDLEFEVRDASGEMLDHVDSYLGLRDIRIDGNQFYLNDRVFHPRMVLDQGYYPDGIWTAPNDEAMRRDIELGLECGFNSARLHQKVFEERYLYWADRLGYLVTGEFPSWRMNVFDPEAQRNFLNEVREVVLRDRNHPCIFAWCPLNEVFDQQMTAETRSVFVRLGQYEPFAAKRLYREFSQAVYAQFHAVDPTRPVHGASGGAHVRTDIWSCHLYGKDAEEFRQLLADEHAWAANLNEPYGGQPLLVDEFGMIHAKHDNLPDIAKQIEAMAGDPRVSGWCFVQLYDVEQEQNGLFTYERKPKFTKGEVRRVFLPQEPELPNGQKLAHDVISSVGERKQ